LGWRYGSSGRAPASKHRTLNSNFTTAIKRYLILLLKASISYFLMLNHMTYQFLGEI
jgi:hypothetical protein